MIVKFRFPFNSIVKDEEDEDGLKTTRLQIPMETYKKLRELLPDLPEDPLSEKATYSIWHVFTGHLESVLDLVHRIEIDSVVRVSHGGTEELEECMGRITSKLYAMETRIDRYQEQLFNKKVAVHIPGNAMIAFDSVSYECDCCTDRINELLNEGWRIIAVCPQPDQRRPDYIFGHIEET